MRNPTNIPIYNLINELRLMKKTLYPLEIYIALGILSDSQMLFINKFKPDSDYNLISSIIYFPYTPEIITHINCPENFIKTLSNFLKLSSK